MKYGLLLCFLTLFFAGREVSARTRKAGHTTITVTDSARGQRKIPVEIWYPEEIEEKDHPPAGEGKPLTVIVFGHGYLLAPGSYRHLVDLVVPEGYVVAFPLAERGMFPSHRRLAEDLAFVAGQVASWNGEHGSLFYGRLSETVCLMGHSMGGGAAVLAAAMEPRIRGLALLAPYDTRPSAIEAACGVSCPTLVIAGSTDGSFHLFTRQKENIPALSDDPQPGQPCAGFQEEGPEKTIS